MATTLVRITLHGAIGLKPKKMHFGRMNPAASIKLVGHNTNTTPQKTLPHENGHTNPVWEWVTVIQLPADAFNGQSLYNINVEIKHESHVTPARLIGSVTIPLREVLFGDRNRVGHLVMTKGNVHGTLVISHSLIPTTLDVVAAAAAAAGEDDHVDAAVGGVGTNHGPMPLLPAQAPGAPAQGTSQLVNMAFATTSIADNFVNSATNIVESFENN